MDASDSWNRYASSPAPLPILRSSMIFPKSRSVGSVRKPSPERDDPLSLSSPKSVSAVKTHPSASSPHLTIRLCPSFFRYASAANCSDVEASPSKVDSRQIPRQALTASNSLPALVETAVFILLSAMREMVFSCAALQIESS